MLMNIHIQLRNHHARRLLAVRFCCREAWKKLGDMSKEEAMKLYVEEMYKVVNGGYVIFCLRAQLIEWRSRMVSLFESVDSFAVLPSCAQPAVHRPSASRTDVVKYCQHELIYNLCGCVNSSSLTCP